MVRLTSAINLLMELRKIAQHPYLSEPEMEDLTLSEAEQHRRLIEASGKLKFLKLLLPELKSRGFRILLFSQFKIVLDRVEDFLYGEGYKYLRLDGDVAQVNRQKDMDKFNAPDSDYFVFLLTTRAGGVGINLASADAVILFDPDFNPHQDMQAISRSHRYGQKKRVVVFRLMSDNSVESKIINNGKRKMVLDHLVVQQLGQETEEGEVDNLILFGAEEIAKSNPDDTSTDRVWTKELINELIDGAEKEAEEQAKEMAARESAVETREGSENSGGDAAEKRGFSFARVWETKTHTFQDPEDTDVNEPEPFADDETWAKFLDAAEKERQVEEAIVLTDRKRKAAAKALSYNERILSLSDEDEDSDKKKRKKDKGKGKAIVDDEDFVASLVEPSDSDSEVDAQFDSVLDGPSALVRDSRGPSNVDPTGHKLSKAERHALKRRQEALRATVLGTGMVNAAAGPVIVGPSNAGTAGPSIAGPSSHTLSSSLSHEPGVSLSSDGNVFRPTVPGMPAPEPAQRPPPPQHNPKNALSASRIAAARQILVLLKGELIRLKHPSTSLWYGIANTDMPAGSRKVIYIKVAESVDEVLVTEGQRRKFTSQAAIQVMNYYIDLGSSVLADHVPQTGQLAQAQQARPPESNILRPTSIQMPDSPPQQAQAQAPPQQRLALTAGPMNSLAQPNTATAVSARPLPPVRPPPPHPQEPKQPVPKPAQVPGPVHFQPNPQMFAPGPMPVYQQQRLPTQGIMPYPPMPAYPMPLGNNFVPPGNNFVPPPVTFGPPPNALPPQVNVYGQAFGFDQPPPPPVFTLAQQAFRPMVFEPLIPQRPAQQPHHQPHQHQHQHQHQHHAPQQQQRSQQVQPQTGPSTQLQPGPPQPKPKQRVERPHKPKPPKPANAHVVVESPVVVNLSMPAPEGAPASLQSAVPVLTASTPQEEGRTAAPSPGAMQFGDSSRFGPPMPADETAVCYWCQGDHQLKYCPKLVPLSDLGRFKKEISQLPDSDDKANSLMAIQKMREAHAENDAAKAKRTRDKAAAKAAANGTSSGTAAASSTANTANGQVEVIVIDDDEPPSKKQWTTNTAEARPTASQPKPLAPNPKPPTPKPSQQPPPPQPNQRPTPISALPGCVICEGPTPHPARECPVVMGGADSIAQAMKRFQRGDNTWSILDTLRQSVLSSAAPEGIVCPYCGKACSKTVRQCVESSGTRKQLKAKIREEQRGEIAPTDKGALDAANGEIKEIEARLAVVRPIYLPLLEAYLSWPNPGRPSQSQG